MIPQYFIDKYINLSSNNMEKGWNWYLDAKRAVKEGKIPVLGSFIHVQSFTRNGKQYYRLSERWSITINDIWIDSLIEEDSPFLLITPTIDEYLKNKEYGTSVYGREINKLITAGYNIPMNDFSISKSKARYIHNFGTIT